eukprot:scaffold104830_cov20-Prasinocladus_malaysianus.AAC.1
MMMVLTGLLQKGDEMGIFIHIIYISIPERRGKQAKQHFNLSNFVSPHVRGGHCEGSAPRSALDQPLQKRNAQCCPLCGIGARANLRAHHPVTGPMQRTR